MTATVALYCPPVIVRGQQCAKAPLTAGGATEQLPGGVAVSRAGGGLTAEPSWLPSAAGAASHRNTVRRPAGRRLVMVAQMSGCRSWLGVALSASSVSVHASGVRCPLVRCPLVRCPLVRCLLVRCPMSGCPLSGVSGVGVRVPRPRPRPLCPHGCLRGARRAATRLSRRRRCWASGHVGLDLVVVVEALGQRTGFDRMAGQGHAGCAGSPVGLGEQVGARCTPSCGMAARRSSGQGWRQAADHDLGWTAAATTSGARAVDLGPGVARSGRVLGSTAAEGARPHRGPSGQGARPGWARQPSELGEQWWACQDLNLGPHPYQVSRAQRCADRRFPRSLASVRGEGMRSIGA
jgi:hypothetical protein